MRKTKGVSHTYNICETVSLYKAALSLREFSQVIVAYGRQYLMIAHIVSLKFTHILSL